MWTGLYRPRSISQRLPCVSLATTCKLGCLLPDKREGTEDQGSYLVVQGQRVTSEVRQTCKAGLPGKGPGSTCRSSDGHPSATLRPLQRTTILSPFCFSVYLTRPVLEFPFLPNYLQS